MSAFYFLDLSGIMAANSPVPKKTIVVSAEPAAGQQFVVTQSKGTTIIQPTSGAGSQQYIVTGLYRNHGLGSRSWYQIIGSLRKQLFAVCCH